MALYGVGVIRSSLKITHRTVVSAIIGQILPRDITRWMIFGLWGSGQTNRHAILKKTFFPKLFG
jgi:hypothetical protein